MRLMFQGLFLAPQIVGEAIKVSRHGNTVCTVRCA